MDYKSTKSQERKILDWLDTIQPETHALFLLGDIFDFWFEYQHVIPKGFVRLQNKLAYFTENDIPVYLVVGNHDYWMQDYFSRELNIQVLYKSTRLYIGDKKLLVGHGDELGGSKQYQLLKKYIYNNSILRAICSYLPTSWLFSLGRYVSELSYKRHALLTSYPPERDTIFDFCKNKVEPFIHHDYYVFGHLHFPYHKLINEHSIYFNLGDWITHFSYGIFDGVHFRLAKFE